MNAPDDCPIRSDDDLVLIGCRPTNHLFLHPKPRDRPRERGVFLPSTQLLRRRCRGARTGDDLQICCSCQRNFYPIERLQKPLTPADWDRVKEAQAAASFWSADPDGEFRPMFDGSHWTIRGCQG